MKKFYITTAIDYVNSLPHIGTAYEKIGADVLARYTRARGYEVHFQMGNDEHSVNVLKAAREKGLPPKQYCDQMRIAFERVWKSLNISHDGFIQTSEPHHEKGVQKLFEILLKKGDIYKAPYKGWYCESCEAYTTEKDLAEGLCPIHKSKPKWLEEENYFFRLSKYEKKLLAHIQKNKAFILPSTRRNEILSLLKEGLKDISVSRASSEWGIPLPGDSTHVVYVWFDALINYMTAVGFGGGAGGAAKDAAKNFKKWWPADMHVIGKDITRFHCVIWPAMLMAAGLPLPKTVFGHGFVYLRGEKMSKTLGNVVTPMDVVAAYGADALRYYLLRTSSFGNDGDFTWDDFIRRYNGDLANGLGNLVSRTLGMIEQYLGGQVEAPKSVKDPLGKKMAAAIKSAAKKVSAAMDYKKGDINFHDALAAIWGVIAEADGYINANKPWEIAKTSNLKLKLQTSNLEGVLGNVAAAIREISILLRPFLPTTAEAIWKQFGFDDKKIWSVKKGAGLFPRIEEKKIEEKPMETTNQIDITEFAKVDLCVAQIIEAQKVEGADKLLRLQIDLGTERRQIVAGIAQHYAPEELVGKKIVVVANLKPAKIRGVESHGMLLAASDANTISILTPFKDVAVGAKVK